MQKHKESHPQRDEMVQVKFLDGHPQIPGSSDGTIGFIIEDWWDKMTGDSWMNADGNPACLIYALRMGRAGLPIDDEVVYGKVEGLGHLVHVSEIVKPTVAEMDGGNDSIDHGGWEDS